MKRRHDAAAGFQAEERENGVDQACERAKEHWDGEGERLAHMLKIALANI